MLNRRFNFNDLFSEFDSLFEGFGWDTSPMTIKVRKSVDSGSDDNGEWTKETYTSEDGTYQVTSIYRYNTPTTKKESNEISVLKEKMYKAVESQDFEEAAKLRDKIQSLTIQNQDKLSKLQKELDKAISKQDFESAIKLRDKIKKYKS